MHELTGNRIPILSWSPDLEPSALRQAQNLATLDIAYHHVAIMPDAHQGFGMPIGGVLATIATIIPNAVGVDIGCGMRAVQTNHREAVPHAILQKIIDTVENTIPLGFRHHHHPQSWDLFSQAPDSPLITRELENAKTQLGIRPEKNIGWR